MISIIFAVLLGIGFAVIATHDTTSIAMTIAGNVVEVPVYIIAAISFLFGIFVSLLFHLADLMSVENDIQKRDKVIKEFDRNTQLLTTQVTNLSRENQQLKQDLSQTKATLRGEQVQRTKETVKNFFGRLRHSI